MFCFTLWFDRIPCAFYCFALLFLMSFLWRRFLSCGSVERPVHSCPWKGSRIQVYSFRDVWRGIFRFAWRMNEDRFRDPWIHVFHVHGNSVFDFSTQQLFDREKLKSSLSHTPSTHTMFTVTSHTIFESKWQKQGFTHTEKVRKSGNN